MITHIMMVQSKAASKNRLLELTHLLSSYRTQLMTKAAAVHAASSLSEVINSFLTQTQTLTALAPRKGVIRRATGTILWGLGKTLKFILDSPFHILSIPLRLFGLVLRLFGVSKKWAGTPNRWWYKLRTPYYILLVTIALGAATALAAKVAHDREKLTPWTTDPLLTYVINPFIKGNLDAGGIDQGDSSFDIGNLDKGSLESFAVGAAQGFTGAVAAPFVTVGGWGNYLLSKTLGPNGRHIPFTKRTVGPVAPDALRDAVDRLGAAHDTHIATVARKRHFKAFNESLKADLTPDQRALSFTEKLALYPRYQPPAGGTQ